MSFALPRSFSLLSASAVSSLASSLPALSNLPQACDRPLLWSSPTDHPTSTSFGSTSTGAALFCSPPHSRSYSTQAPHPRRHNTKAEFLEQRTLPPVPVDSPLHHLLKRDSSIDDTSLLKHPSLDSRRMALARLLRRHNYSIPHLKGQAILATVLQVTDNAVFVDPGFYGISEIPRKDLGVVDIHLEAGEEPVERASVSDLRVGDVVQVKVFEVFSPYGDMQLDVIKEDKRAQQGRVWQEIAQLHAADKPVFGRVLNACTGGYAVGIAGLVALLPHSRCTATTVSRIGSLETFYIDMMDERTSRVIVSDARFSSGRPREKRKLNSGTHSLRS
eukprot:gene3128-13140_t